MQALFPLRTVEVRDTGEPADESFRSGAVQVDPPDAAVKSGHHSIERTALEVAVKLRQCRLELLDTKCVRDDVDESIGGPLRHLPILQHLLGRGIEPQMGGKIPGAARVVRDSVVKGG